MGRHIILRNLPEGGHERLRGIFTDAQFDRLPWVKQLGAFPRGLCAAHFGDTDTPATAHYLKLPESPDNARELLKRTWEVAHRYQYELVTPMGHCFFSNQRTAETVLRRFAIDDWRGSHNWHARDVCCRICTKYGYGRYTAIKEDRDGQLAYTLKVKHRRVADAYVVKHDLRTVPTIKMTRRDING